MEQVHIQAGGIVAATALEADETVLNDINTTDTVVVANLVEELEKLEAVGDLLLVLGHNLDGNTLLEVDGELIGLVRGVKGVDSAASRGQFGPMTEAEYTYVQSSLGGVWSGSSRTPAS